MTRQFPTVGKRKQRPIEPRVATKAQAGATAMVAVVVGLATVALLAGLAGLYLPSLLATSLP